MAVYRGYGQPIVPDLSGTGLYPQQAEAKQKRALADALLAQAVGGNNGTGWGALGQALAGAGAAYRGRQAGTAETTANDLERQAALAQRTGVPGAMDAVFTGGAPTPGAAPAAPAMTAPAPTAGGASSSDPFVSALHSAGASGGSDPLAGVDMPAYLARMGQKESGGDYGATNALGSGATGKYQAMPGTWRDVMGDAPMTPANQETFGVKFTAGNAATLKRAGVPVNEDTLSLAHQQGAGGAIKLLSNPNGLAADTVGRIAVVQNVGDPNMTNAQFAQHVMGYYSGSGAGGAPGGGGASVFGGGAGPTTLPPDMDPLDRLTMARMAHFVGEDSAQGQAYMQQIGGGYTSPADRTKFEANRSDEGFDRWNAQQQNDLAQQRMAQSLSTSGGQETWLSPQVAQKPDGTFGLLTMSNRGNTKWLDAGVDPKTQIVGDTGFDKRTMEPIGTTGAAGAAIAGGKASTTIGDAVGTARVDLPRIAAQAQATVQIIDGLLTDPQLPKSFGRVAGRMPDTSQEATDLTARVTQLKSRQFLDGVAALKGMGALSNAEGEQISAAVANLDFRQSPEQVIETLQTIKDTLASSVARMQSLANGAPIVGGTPTPPAPPPAAAAAPTAAPRAAPVVINGYKIEQVE